MPRSSFLAAVLLFAFFVFVTTKGELLQYLGTIGLGPDAGKWHSAPPTQYGAANPGSGSGSSSGSWMDKFKAAMTDAQEAAAFTASTGV